MLYIEPIFLIGGNRKKYGYANDIGILCTASSLTECTKKLATELAEMIVWGARNAISFDSEKIVLQHFIQASKLKEYSTCDLAGKEVQANQSTRWPWILPDRKLSFFSHVSK